MLTNPNKLAFKGSPGPWCVYKNTYKFEIQEGKEPSELNLRVVECGYHGTPSHEKYEANAHLISAAPEAVEFIADLLWALHDTKHILPNEVYNVVIKAEEILKKAYNF